MNWRQLFEDRNRFFWVLQLTGWIGYALIQYIASLTQETRDIYVIIVALGAYAGFLLTIPLRYLYQRIWNVRPWWLAIIVLFASLCVAALWAVIDNATNWEIYQFGYRPINPFMYFNHTVAKLYIILSWSGLYFVIKYYQMLQDEKQKALTAVSMAHQSQLKMLRYQLNPHFLFNTLNAISTLILVEESKAANKMMSRLSDFLRFSLDNEPIKRITLAREIEVLMLYLDIEKVRFEERLQVRTDISDDAAKALVPSMFLQPIIENSIKYAIAKLESQGIIEIKAWVANETLHVQISDNGPEVYTPETETKSVQRQSGGVGLSNTKERLKALYGKQYYFNLSANNPTGCIVDIQIPWQVV
ncbi:sensor histidine kinase [Aliidiomarina maris]|uniref:Histidine kinase n=1 Tax=Aliidiomarina maris TaxID=531312 RepID=A0A327WZS8_9GAMM|nr:histidine kinase [Aliidiomarina maris]RAJ98959.1 histidine kinase [Aliidiomarina maris]RUO25100.1 sensor histidine kinase [Aliidiomarina maris]